MSGSPGQTLLSVRNLSVGAAGKSGIQPILRDVSFDLAEQRILGIIGETGSGKSVLSRAVAAWLTPPLTATYGTVEFRGRDLLRMPDAELRQIRGSQIAYIGSNPSGALDPTLPVGRQIVEKLRTIEPGTSTAEARDRVIGLLAAVRIPSPASRFDEYPSQYSGGMMQRALIVDALVAKPALLIADNVTQPLDVTVAAQILRLMRELRTDFKTAVLFVSASLPVVADIADDILVLSRGAVVECQPAADLVRAPAHDYTRRLISLTPKIWAVGAGVPAEKLSAGGAAPTQGETPILSIRGLSRTYVVRRRGGFLAYNRIKAVRDVSFDVREGENFGIIGESGCGKSTLTRLLARLEVPDSGEILFGGQRLWARSRAEQLKFRRALQLVLQDPYTSLPPRMTVGRAIEEALLIHKMGGTAASRRGRVSAVMSEVGLPEELYDQLPTGLSAGQRQRVSLARALVLEPRILILDETLSSLDQPEQMRLIELFRQLQAQRGLTYIFISHDLAMVRQVCSRLAVMYLGEIVELAGNEALFRDPGHPYTKALLSAVPTMETRPFDSRDHLLEGEPPSPIDLPPGCSFASRCPQRFGRCVAETPKLVLRQSGDFSACFLAAETAEPEAGR
jgi:peptide/nickel transport system ATP-binding protein